MIDEKLLADLERMDNEAMPPDWQMECYSSGGRVVRMNSFTVPGEYGDDLPCSGINRHLSETRQVLCDCCPASARHWVPARHDDQEWQDLAYVAALRNAAPELYSTIRELQRRLDAVLAMLEPSKEQMTEAQVDYQMNVLMGHQMELHRRAVEIAEGKT